MNKNIACTDFSLSAHIRMCFYPNFVRHIKKLLKIRVRNKHSIIIKLLYLFNTCVHLVTGFALLENYVIQIVVLLLLLPLAVRP